MSRFWTRSNFLAQIDTTAIAPAMAAILLGAFLIIGAGLAHPNALHNAAHDSRHSLAFPCH